MPVSLGCASYTPVHIFPDDPDIRDRACAHYEIGYAQGTLPFGKLSQVPVKWTTLGKLCRQTASQITGDHRGPMQCWWQGGNHHTRAHQHNYRLLYTWFRDSPSPSTGKTWPGVPSRLGWFTSNTANQAKWITLGKNPEKGGQYNQKSDKHKLWEKTEETQTVKPKERW